MYAPRIWFSKRSCKYRIAFELVRLQELSHSDAAAVLGVSVMSVKLRMHRASKALRATIENIEEEAVRESWLRVGHRFWNALA
jgi:DNA-directed RNA polymerase specialized sigma24 family protein